MTAPRIRLSIEPRLLGRDDAAAYCGVSVGTFDALVNQGTYPKPIEYTIKGKTVRRLVWDRRALDASIDRLSGIGAASLPDMGERLRRAREAQAR